MNVQSRLFAHAIAMLMAITIAGAQAGPSARELFERARVLEAAKQNTPEVIRLYEQAASAATDDPALATAARARATALRGGSAATAQTARRIAMAPGFGPTSFSEDGRVAVGSADGGGLDRVALYEFASGKLSPLVPAGRLIGTGADAVISPDGKLVAYSWNSFNMETRTPDSVIRSLRVINAVAGATERTLLAPEPTMFGVSPVAWSRDSTRILVSISRAEPATPGADLKVTGFELGWIPAAGGPITVIKRSPRGRFPTGFMVSFDGRFLTYVVPGPVVPETRIYISDMSGQNEVEVVSMAGTHGRPLWTPDGRHLLFTSNRGGSNALWSIPVRDGKPAGDPIQVRAGGQIYFAINKSGTIYFRENTRGGGTVFVADRSAASTRILQNFPGQAATPSPDGSQIAFIRQGQPDNDLIVRSFASGSERMISHTGLAPVAPKWVRDGSGLIVFVQAAGDSGQPGGAFYHIDLKTGAFTRRFARNTDKETRAQMFTLSPDGRTLFTTARDAAQPADAPWTSIVGLDSATGAERARIALPGAGARGSVGLRVSPDGREIAVHVWTGIPPEVQGTAQSRIFVVRTDGSGSRDLVAPFTADRTTGAAQWTPDGRSLLYYQQNVSDGSWRLMRVPASGGTAVAEGLTSAGLRANPNIPDPAPFLPAGLELTPDGSRIIFPMLTSPRIELWALDDVMSILR